MTATRTYATVLETYTKVVGTTATAMPSKSTASTEPKVTNTPQVDGEESEPRPSSSTGLIVGVTIGVVVFSIIIASILFILIKKKRKQKRISSSTDQDRPQKQSLYSLERGSTCQRRPSQHDIEAQTDYVQQPEIPLQEIRPAFAQRPRTIATTIAGTFGTVQTTWARIQQAAALKERQDRQDREAREEQARKDELLRQHLAQEEADREHRESSKRESERKQAEQEDTAVADLVDRREHPWEQSEEYPERAFSIQGVIVPEQRPERGNNFLAVPQQHKYRGEWRSANLNR